MYALAINGSPRKDGNTHLLLGKVLEPLDNAGWETEIYQLGGKLVHGCTACWKCWDMKNKQCVISNDCINEIIGKMVKADAIIIGTPTYFANPTAEVKALLDRSGFVAGANNDMFKGKIGVAVAAVRRGGAVNAVEAIMRMYLIRGMVIPGSTYWNMGYGLEKGECANDEEGLENMKNLGETVALLGKALAPYKAEWPG